MKLLNNGSEKSSQISDATRPQTRIMTFDLVKFIAIFCVLWGHIIQYLRHQGECYENLTYQIIYSFHMPLFMIVVGFFGATCMKNGFKRLLCKKTLQLILPGITSSVIICVIMKLQRSIEIFEVLIFSLWFLKAAFLCFVLYAITFASPKFHKQFIFVTFIVSQVIFYSQFNLMYPCFLFGIILNSFWNDFKNQARLISVISGILFLTMLAFWDDTFWKIPSGGVYPIHNLNQFRDFTWQFYYRLFIGLSGSTFIIATSELVCKRFKNSKSILFLSNIGQNTLGIYLLQTIIIELLLWRWFNYDEIDVSFFQYIIAPLLSVAILFVCLVLLKIIRKSKYASLIILGEVIRTN